MAELGYGGAAMMVRAFESRGEYFLHILSIWCLPSVVGSRGRSGQSRARSTLVGLPLGSLLWKVGIDQDEGGAEKGPDHWMLAKVNRARVRP